MKNLILKNVLLITGIALALGNAQAAPKKFKRALVIAGGGITPAVGLGIIAGAESMGWKPDVIITTCGASMSAAIYNAYMNSKESQKYVYSNQFQTALLNAVQIDTVNVLSLKNKFDTAATSKTLPDLFRNNVIKVNQDLSGSLPRTQFNASEQSPKFIMLAAKANFGPSQVGTRIGQQTLFKQVYFTDVETGKLLQGMTSPIKKAFPNSRVAAETQVITDKSTVQATRASIADPFLADPAEIDGSYYFTGAVDLFPIDTAQSLADDVLVTYPSSLFTDYEDVAIKSTFGFSQRQRALQTIQHQDVKWIDMSGIDAVSFTPTPFLLTIMNNIPTSAFGFYEGIRDQYGLGYNRTQEALQVQSKRKNVRTHLREPISPKLINGFTCANASVWKTTTNGHCTSDNSIDCNRKGQSSCVPIR